MLFNFWFSDLYEQTTVPTEKSETYNNTRYLGRMSWDRMNKNFNQYTITNTFMNWYGHNRS